MNVADGLRGAFSADVLGGCVNTVNGTDLTVNGGDPMDLSTNITLCTRADLVFVSPS